MKRKDWLAEPRRPRLLPVAARGKFRVLVLLLLALPLTFANGAQLKQARVTQVVQDVKLLPGQAAPRPARVTDEVREGTAVRTGTESRSELTFPDQTLARLGANTIFSFNEGTRNLDLQGGAMLLRVPKNAGGAQIQTAAITAAITGTTIMLEYHPNAFSKFIVLEGTGRIFRKGHLGESVLVHAGQMLIVNPNGTTLPEPVDVDLERLMKTSVLITGFPPLLSTDLIGHEIAVQTERKNEGGLIDTNLVIFGGGTTVDRLDPTQATVVDQANSNEMRQDMLSPTPTPSESPSPTVTPTVTPTISPTVTPTPSKFGTPTVISSPVPYVIGSGTTITTDPTITTNGVTDFGKQYRSLELDGSVSTYLFGSTSAFDSQIHFDDIVINSETLPAAVFKFLALRLAGNPTISLANGGVSTLALVSVGDLTSGAPGGILTFDGIDAMLLATQDGSITFGPEISFEGIPRLFFYARGAGSTLTLDSALSDLTNLILASEGDIVFNNAFNLTESDATDNGLQFNLIAGTNLVANNGLTITVDNSNGGDLGDQDALVSLQTGQDMTANGDAGLNLTIANNAGGHIGSDARIDLFAGGNLTASALTFLINNRDAGSIDGGASILLDATGAVNVTNDAEVVITTRNDGLGGGTINGGASINFNAASVSTGGFMDLALSANAGGTLSNATILANVPGAVNTTGGYSSEIQSTGFNVPGGPFVQGGMITGEALLTLSFGSVSSGPFFDIEIDNFGQGTIGGDALLSVGVAGDLNATGDILTDIINTAVQSGGAIIPGGTIGGNATVNVGVGGDIIASGVGEFAVLNNDLNFLSQAGTIMGDALVSLSATNITTGGFFQPLVNNTNGTIGGSASVFVTTTGDINVGAETFFNILNTGGSIGGDALSTLVGNNFTTGTTFQFQILNDQGGIGGNAFLTAGLNGALTIGGDATIQIGNNTGSIGQDATIDFNLGSFSANSLLLQIDNTGGIIGGTSDINFITNGDMTINGGALTATFLNIGSNLGSGGDVSVVTGGMLSAGSIAGLIDNSGGFIGTGGNILVSTGSDFITTSGGVSLTIQNTGGIEITTGGNITLTADGSVSTQGQLSLLVENYDETGSPAGHIGTGGNISVTTGGDLSAQSVIGLINNRSGGQIDSPVSLTLSIGGVLTTSGESTDPFGFPESLGVQISTRFDNLNGNPAGASTVGGDATLTVNADSASIGGRLTTIIGNSGSTLNGNALLSLGITNDVSIQGEADIEILNDADIASPLGGILHGSATLQVLANNFTANALFAQIDNRDGAVIDSNAALTFDLTGSFAIPGTNPGDPDFDSTVPGEADLFVENQKRAISQDSATSGGTIGGDALIQLSASSASTAGALNVEIQNFSNGSGSTGGNIGGNVTISLNIAGGLTTQGAAFFNIANQNNGGTSGGTIGRDATITVAANTLTASSLTAQINNLGGTIGGTASINMNVVGNATVAGDATIEILGSDGASAAAINVNGGNYDAVGTFLTEIDGDGAITFNNVIGHADVLKVGALGTNGVLTIGGGSLSGDTQLKLYASGSNGTVNFISNVSLSSNSSVLIAGNTVTINNGVTVTIAGDDGVAASVFTNVPNYTGSGGNGTTTGMFGGNGAATPAPLDQAPPFNDPGDKSATGSATSTAKNNAPVPTTNSASSGDRSGGAAPIAPRGKRYVPIARVANSNQLLDLADKVTSAPTEAGHARSGAPNGRTSRGSGSGSLGKGRVLSPVLSADRASLTLNRGLARPALLP